MSGSDIVPQNDENGVERFDQHVPRRADDPFAQQGMPLALLEFHSPSAALVNMPPTPAARHIIWLISGLFAASIIAAGIFPLNRVVSTPGRLVSLEPTLVVQPLETSIIRSIDVHVGDFVHKGQVLAHLDPTVSTADITNMKSQRDSYQAQVDRLKAEADGHDYRPNTAIPASVEQGAAFARRQQEYTAKIAQFDGQIASLQSQIEGDLANAAMYQSRSRVASQVLEMRRSLQRDQVGSRLSTLAAQNDLMEAERAQISAQQDANSAKSRLVSTQAEKENYVQNWKSQVYSDLNIAEHRLDESVSDYEKANLRNSLVVLRAPQDAVVLTVAHLSVGSVVATANQIMSLVPTGYGLEMEAVLRGQDAGFVHLGDHALLKFTTFPYDQYGGAEATVRTISADAFSGEQNTGGAQGGGGQGGDSTSLNGYYRVRLRIDRYTLHGVPTFFHPIPGLPVTADINVGKRTPLRYFFNRIIPAATNGMREPS
ncbi:major facilitator superfamily multidrug resistance transporter EmrA/FusE [Neoasaia chiangmaiensis NBRC 101099]|uniref:Membrane fusion protein (MFP) family protein n=1 Tax=Neoasaia chiangmaiensis TaxID=320497 RepID=A0A1U9KNW4_9PROT|nr:HlyD family type I secretion periplasmic adaptor subunit [Neoasaia chiangmaiensis]AQS87492.1 multidrug ABC transporter [Neoasaia chiangmaiensis]GBR42508.1 major facilitator superfamily multidrug resistance transporter EmrA/FusE [Neoasaia chiangmaiensis NBRC 101099]GEN16287.1 HlyD family type I secretion periplasmic adaptor subunit [Neoasaia chiangmaiensis]